MFRTSQNERTSAIEALLFWARLFTFVEALVCYSRSKSVNVLVFEREDYYEQDCC